MCVAERTHCGQRRGRVHPAETWVGVRNDGPDTLVVFYVFPTPGFTDYMRQIGSPTPVGRDLSATASARIDAAHGIVYRRRSAATGLPPSSRPAPVRGRFRAAPTFR